MKFAAVIGTRSSAADGGKPDHRLETGAAGGSTPAAMGFDGIVVPFESDTEQAGADGLPVLGVSLSQGPWTITGWGGGDAGAGSDTIIGAMDLARRVGADLVLVPMTVGGGPAEAGPFPRRFEDAYSRAVAALSALRFDAQRRAVHVACEFDDPRFMPSPMEVRSFIDRVNSPWVGVCLNVAAVVKRQADPADWILALGYRLFAIRLDDTAPPDAPAGSDATSSSDAGWNAVAVSLRQIRFDGLLLAAPNENLVRLRADLVRAAAPTSINGCGDS